jgi:hypothetical protein
MVEACYTARATTKQQVFDGINKLTLQTNEHGQYTHDAIFVFQKGIQRSLLSQFNPSDPGKGMVKLLDDGENILTRVNQLAKKRADELSTTTGKTILPTFTTRSEAQEEADRLNVINQLVIGTKEGVVEAVSKLVGSNITDAILRTADGSYHKSIDDFTLYEVMKVAINGTDRPSTNDVLEQLLEVINHPFDFRKKVQLSQEGQRQHGTDSIECGIYCHVWHCHWYPTAHAHTFGQHQDGHQIQ